MIINVVSWALDLTLKAMNPRLAGVQEVVAFQEFVVSLVVSFVDVQGRPRMFEDVDLTLSGGVRTS